MIVRVARTSRPLTTSRDPLWENGWAAPLARPEHESQQPARQPEGRQAARALAAYGSMRESASESQFVVAVYRA